jgi:hypothetical protein
MANHRTCLCCTVLATATALLVLAACGSGAAESATSPTTPTSEPTVTSPSANTTRRGPQPVQVQYLMQINNPDAEGPPQARYDILTDGGTRVRLKLTFYSDPGVVEQESLYTWDGNRILEFSRSNEVPYTVYEAPNEHTDELQQVTSWVTTMWSAVPDQDCTDLKTTKTIIGRIATGYRCVQATPEPGVPAASDVWVDQATGILLSTCRTPCGSYEAITAQKLVLNPKIDATTFSTQPPAGAKVIVIAAENAPPGQTKKAPDFTLDLVKGGRIGLKDLAGKPFVLAFFSSHLAFDESGDAFPGYRDALLTLQTLTSNGTKPRVLAVQEGSLGKPGHPLVVPGLTLTLAHEETQVVQGSFALASFVFVRSDGTIAASYDRAPTKQQITQRLAALQ